MPAPGATTIIDTVPLPAWWSTATTVQIVSIDGSATFNVGDLELFAYGVSYPDNEGVSWRAGVIPWQRIININRVT